MATVALSGADTITINNRILADLADGDIAVLTFPNEIAQVKTGKNGNSIYGLNESGKQSELVLRLIRGSADDKFMNGLLVNQQANFAGFVLMIGELVKKIGKGDGTLSSDIYILSGGVFTKQVEAKVNVEGDTDQSVSVYTIKFSNAPRAIT
jgi:hypothetical protein